MRPEALDPALVRRLRAMTPEERLRAAFDVHEMAERLTRAGEAHRRGSDEAIKGQGSKA